MNKFYESLHSCRLKLLWHLLFPISHTPLILGQQCNVYGVYIFKIQWSNMGSTHGIYL